jgi:hypothetical protein
LPQGEREGKHPPHLDLHLPVPEGLLQRRHARIRCGAESHSALTILHENPFDPELAPKDAQYMGVQKALDLLGEGTVPIDDLLPQPLRLLAVLQLRKPSVKMQFLAGIRNIAVRNICGTGEGNFRLWKFAFAPRTSAKPSHRFLQHPQVGIEPDGVRESGLIGAEKIAGSSEFEISQRHLVSTSEFGVAFEDLDPLMSLLRHLVRDNVVTIGTAIRSPDPPSEMVERR